MLIRGSDYHPTVQLIALVDTDAWPALGCCLHALSGFYRFSDHIDHDLRRLGFYSQGLSATKNIENMETLHTWQHRIAD